MTWTWQRGPSARRLRRRLGAGARSRWLHGAVARRVGCGPLRHELISPRSRSAWIAAPGSGDPRPWLVALLAGYRIHLAIGPRSDCPMPCQVYDGIGWQQDVPGSCTTRRFAVGAVDRQRCPSPSQRRTRARCRARRPRIERSSFSTSATTASAGMTRGSRCGHLTSTAGARLGGLPGWQGSSLP